MESGGFQVPPSKRRKLFSDPEEASSDGIAYSSDYSSPAVPRERFFKTEPDVKNEREPLSDWKDDGNGHVGVAAPADEPISELPPPKFDQKTLESIIGSKVSSQDFVILRKRCGENLERAVNMYLDGTFKTSKPTTSSTSSKSSKATTPPSQVQQVKQEETPVPLAIRGPVPKSRYIGAFGVEGWTTRSGANLLKYGDVVKIERQKIVPQLKGKGSGAGQVRLNNAAARRVDVLVRFTTANGMEIGRLAKDAAEWISTLIDQEVCRFEGSCVYAPERLRTNDTVFLQLRCYILRCLALLFCLDLLLLLPFCSL